MKAVILERETQWKVSFVLWPHFTAKFKIYSLRKPDFAAETFDNPDVLNFW